MMSCVHKRQTITLHIIESIQRQPHALYMIIIYIYVTAVITPPPCHAGVQCKLAIVYMSYAGKCYIYTL